MPAAAVIREPRALSGIIGRKGSVGGLVSLSLKHRAQPGTGEGLNDADWLLEESTLSEAKLTR